MTSVRSGLTHPRRPTIEELTLRLEAARGAEAVACSRYTRLRAAVIDWLESRTLENEGNYIVRLEREVGRQR